MTVIFNVNSKTTEFQYKAQREWFNYHYDCTLISSNYYKQNLKIWKATTYFKSLDICCQSYPLHYYIYVGMKWSVLNVPSSVTASSPKCFKTLSDIPTQHNQLCKIYIYEQTPDRVKASNFKKTKVVQGFKNDSI